MRRLAGFALATLTLVLASSAAGAGPWLGAMNGGPGVADLDQAVRYVTKIESGSTTVTAIRQTDKRVMGSTTVAGKWGIPFVTVNSATGGLSADGRVLVLAERFNPTGELRSKSAFTILGTKPLAVKRTVSLKGDFGYDALSPTGRTLYVIEHVAGEDLSSYRVRAYDVPTARLLPRAIADKRQAGWVMEGYPVGRATSADGRWVYTLYQHPNNYPFVHALDTVRRTAVCIGLPLAWTGTSAQAIMNSDVSLQNGRLVIAGNHGLGARFALNTRTFKVTKL